MRSISMLARSRFLPRASALLLAATLAACGGSGDAGDSPGGGTPSLLTLTGTAATGAAVAGGTVDAKCSAGTASGTTQADGSYSVTIAGGTWPCLVRVSTAGGLVLHSVAAGSGSAATANVTPVSQLILASLAGADPSGYYASFDSTAAAAISAAAVVDAQARVVAMLKAAGIDLGALGDLISASLRAQTATGAGDAYDQALDALASALASSGTTLATLTTAVIGNAQPASANLIPSLPAELLLQRATPTCAAMRSSTYRIVTPTANAAMADQSGLAVFDAASMSITRPDGSTGTWAANGNCRFTDQGPGYSADVVVSQAGVLVGRYTRDNGATYKNFVGFAEQAHAVAELAGDWNVMGMSPGAAGFVGNAGSATLDAAGVLTAGATCQNNSTWAVDVCVTSSSAALALVPPFVADAAGGFDSIDASTQTIIGRAFAYRSGSGVSMLAVVGKGGSFAFWAPHRSVPLPAVGAVTGNWNFDIVASLASASANYERSNTITAIDAAPGSYSRIQKTPGTNNDHPETLFVNNPRAGFVFRPAGSSVAVDGSVQKINEFTVLRMPGMGFGVLVLPPLKLFEFYAVQP
jgi:hypothetical protein